MRHFPLFTCAEKKAVAGYMPACLWSSRSGHNHPGQNARRLENVRKIGDNFAIVSYQNKQNSSALWGFRLQFRAVEGFARNTNHGSALGSGRDLAVRSIIRLFFSLRILNAPLTVAQKVTRLSSREP